jgi:hypothetical protein
MRWHREASLHLALASSHGLALGSRSSMAMTTNPPILSPLELTKIKILYPT